MPINKAETFDDSGYVGYAPDEKPEPSFMETFRAASRQNNTVISTLSNPRLEYDVKALSKIDPTFDPYAEIKGYEQYADLFEDVFNKTASDALKARIDMERKDHQTLAQSGWTGFTLGLAAGSIDLPMLIPGGTLLREGKLIYSPLKSAGIFGASQLTSASIQEAGLRTTQVTRTADDAISNVKSSVILGGILTTLGAGAARLHSHVQWKRISKSLDEDLSGEVSNPSAVVNQIALRAHAAGVRSLDAVTPTLTDMGIDGPRAAEIHAKAVVASRVISGIHTLLSRSTTLRQIYLKMVDDPVYSTMQMEDQP